MMVLSESITSASANHTSSLYIQPPWMPVSSLLIECIKDTYNVVLTAFTMLLSIITWFIMTYVVQIRLAALIEEEPASLMLTFSWISAKSLICRGFLYSKCILFILHLVIRSFNYDKHGLCCLFLVDPPYAILQLLIVTSSLNPRLKSSLTNRLFIINIR